jgi:hypothetical protein
MAQIIRLRRKSSVSLGENLVLAVVALGNAYFRLNKVTTAKTIIIVKLG